MPSFLALSTCQLFDAPLIRNCASSPLNFRQGGGKAVKKHSEGKEAHSCGQESAL